MKRKLSNQQLRTQTQKNVRKGNTTVTRKRDGVEDLIEKGAVAELPIKRQSNTEPLVGMSKGITKNMQNYESLRLDVWYSDVVRKGETPQDALQRVEAVIDTVLENTVAYYLDD